MQGCRVCVSEEHEVHLEDFVIDEEKLENKEILVRTKYTMISPGTELSGYTHLEKNIRYPFYPGYISIGEVIKASDESKFVEGDTVFSYSNHASIAKLDPDRRLCMKLPEKVDPKKALFARIATIAMTALRVSNGELGDWAAILGLGLVGNMAANLFKLAGLNVIGLDLIERRLEIAKICGIKHTINPNYTDYRKKILELTRNKGCEIVIEATGNPRSVNIALELSGSLGEVILLGTPRGEYSSDLTKVLSYVHLWHKGCLTLKGAHEWRLPLYNSEWKKHSIERNTKIAFQLISERRLQVEKLITHTIDPSRIKEAYEGLLNRKDEYLGILLDWKPN